jgi:hypothetical protein
MRPKPPPPPPPPTSSTLPKFTAPPPPSSKLLDEREIGDDFRRSIDAALKGLEAIYHTSPVIPSEHTQESHIDNLTEKKDIQPKIVGDEIMLTSESQIRNPISSNEDIECREENLLTNQSVQNKELISSSQQKSKLSNENRPNSFNVNETNENLSKSNNKIEEYNKTLSESLLTPVISPIDTVKSSSHNVTYTEIINSESHDGEQSRHFKTESYDELPTKDDEQTTSLKVVTKSEFSNHPLLGEKIMEQTVQVITVKVRNETIKTTNPSQTSNNNEISYDKKNDANSIDTII